MKFVLILLAILLFFSACNKNPNDPPFDDGGPHIISAIFTVDMNNEINNNTFNPESDFVDMPGTHNDWSNGNNLSDDDGDGIWQIEYDNAIVGDYFEYKFRINGNWDTGELSGQDNRSYTVVEGGTNIISHVYNEPGYTTNHMDVIFQVNMNYQLDEGNFNAENDNVYLVGDFNNWQPQIMTDIDEDFIYEVEIEGLFKGTTYKFNFQVNDNNETLEEREITIEEEETVLFWYNNQVPNYLDVTFRVNMNSQIALGNFMPDDNLLEIYGTFNDWTSGSVLQDSNENGFYTIIIENLNLGEFHEYKYAVNGVYESVYQDSSRSIIISDQTPLVENIYNDQYTNVFFNVNMNYQIELGNFDPEIDILDMPGTHNGWTTGDILTDPDGDGIYQISYNDVNAETVYEYKFRINENWDNAEFPGGDNRTYTVLDGINIVNLWYNDDEPIVVFVNVVFTIEDQTESYEDIRIKGLMNDWNPAQMYDDGTNNDEIANDHVWTITIDNIPNGTYPWGAVEWDGSADGVWLVTDENNEDYNLLFTVDSEGNVSGDTSYVIAPEKIK